MLPKQVCATNLRPSVLRYALELATALRLPLVVVVAIGQANTRLYLETFGETENEFLRRVRLAMQKVLGSNGKESNNIEIADYDGTATGLHKTFPDALVVSDGLDSASEKHAVVDPFSEELLFRNGKKNILLPLGNDPTSAYTFQAGLEFSAKLLSGKGRVVFYHTTWRNPEVISDDPNLHVCSEAAVILAQAKQTARAMNIATEAVVETAPTVAEGIAMAAFRNNAGLIIIARDKSVRFGDYCNQLYHIIRGSIPILIFPDRNGEGR